MKKIVGICAGVLVLLLTALGVFVATFDANQYKDDIIEVVERQTGRDFDIAGELELGFSLVPMLIVDDVTLGNAAWGSAPAMLTVGHFRAQMSLLALLTGTISLNELVLESADILLETNQQGTGNWTFTNKENDKTAKPADADGTSPPEFNIEEIHINNARITYRDTVNEKVTQVSVEEFSAQAGGFNDPMDLFLQAVYQEVPVRIAGKTGSLGDYNDNDEFPIDITANVGTAEFSIKGHIEEPRDLRGLDVDMAFHTDSLADFETIAGRELPDFGPLQLTGHFSEKDGAYFIRTANANVADTRLQVDGKVDDPKNARGLDLVITFEAESLTQLDAAAGTQLPDIAPLKLSARVTDKDGTYNLDDLVLRAGETDLSGMATLNLTGERPALTARLAAGVIDLAPFAGDEDESTKQKEKGGKVFSSEPLPFELLKAADAELDITAKEVRFTDMTLTDVAVELALNNGHLKLSPFNATAAGGSYSLNLDLDASSGNQGVFDTRLDISNFQPAKLPDMQNTISGASTDITLQGKGAGNSMAGIMAGLNGHLLVKVGQGEIRSDKFKILDSDLLASTLSSLNPNKGKQSGRQIECGVINMKIEDGIATSDKNIALLTKRMSIVGSGVINLKTEELNIAIKPNIREGIGLNASSIAELVKVGGTLAEPKAVPDTAAAFKTAASVGAAVATGGVSLLAQGLLKRAKADDNPCATALGVKPASQAPDEKATPSEPSVTDKAVDTVKDAGESIKEGMKGLFD